MSGIITPTIKERKRRIREFYNFLYKNKEKYRSIDQIVSLFGVLSGLSNKTVNSYVRQFVYAGILKLNAGTIVEVVRVDSLLNVEKEKRT